MAIIEIRKPLYETQEGYGVRVWDKYVLEAIKRKEYLFVRTKGEEVRLSPKWVKKNLKVIKQVFKRPEEPMRLYEIFIRKKSPEEKAKADYQLYLS